MLLSNRLMMGKGKVKVVSATYVRLLAVGTSYDTHYGNYFWEIGTLEIYNQENTDVAAGKPCSASSSWGVSPNNAVNGNPSSYWHTHTTSSGSPGWFMVDLGGEEQITSLIVIPRNVSTWRNTVPRSFTVQTSEDSVNWVDVDTFQFTSISSNVVRRRDQGTFTIG